MDRREQLESAVAGWFGAVPGMTVQSISAPPTATGTPLSSGTTTLGSGSPGRLSPKPLPPCLLTRPRPSRPMSSIRSQGFALEPSLLEAIPQRCELIAPRPRLDRPFTDCPIRDYCRDSRIPGGAESHGKILPPTRPATYRKSDSPAASQAKRRVANARGP
jgi:hypothetical protein